MLGNRYMYYIRFVINLFFMVFTWVIMWDSMFNPKAHRASPDTFTVFEVAPFQDFNAITSFLDTSVLVNGKVCTGCSVSGAITSKAALLTKAKTDLDCTGTNFRPGVCNMCVELWSNRLFDFAQLTAGVIDTDSEAWKEIRANYESCFFKHSTWSVAKYFGATNPQLHLFIWCGLMFVYAIMSDSTADKVRKEKEGKKGAADCCSAYKWTSILSFIVLGGIFAVVIFCVAYPMSDPNGKLPESNLLYYDFVTTNVFQIAVILLFYTFFIIAPKSMDAVNGLDAAVVSFTRNNIAFDIVMIAVTPSMASIVCAYTGWLDYSMMTYLSQGITVVMSLVLANDVMGVFWEEAQTKGHDDLIVMHRQTHFFINAVSVLVIVFVWMTNFIDPRVSDPFSGTLHMFLFFGFTIIMVCTPSFFQSHGAVDPRAVLHFKEALELIYRVTVFAIIADIFFIGNDP